MDPAQRFQVSQVIMVRQLLGQGDIALETERTNENRWKIFGAFFVVGGFVYIYIKKQGVWGKFRKRCEKTKISGIDRYTK